MKTTMKCRRIGVVVWASALGALGAGVLGACSSDPAFKAQEPPETEGSGGSVAASGGRPSNAVDSGGATGGASGESGGSGGSGRGSVEDGGSDDEDGGGSDVDAGSSGGRAGTGGSTEDAGPPKPAPECNYDADCVALTCIGEPTCLEGKCVPGTCPNPDADHCNVSCQRLNGRASCILKANDLDGDGHLEQRCTTAPGDDCNDDDRSVYTGAIEVCDGIDNDCDAKIDTDDGVPLGGSAHSIKDLAGPASLGMAASEQGFAVLSIERLGMFFYTSSVAKVLFARVNGDLVSEKEIGGIFNAEALITFTKDGFTTYAGTGTGSEQLLRVPFGGAADLPPTQADLFTRNETGRSFTSSSAGTPIGVFTNYADDQNVSSYRWVRLGEETNVGAWDWLGPQSKPGSGHTYYRPAVDVGENGYGIAFIESDADAGKERTLTLKFETIDTTFKRVGPDLVLQTQHVTVDQTSPLRQETLRPQLASVDKGYFVGWLDAEGLRFSRVSVDGKRVCELTKVPGVVTWGWNNAMTGDGDGIYAAAVNSRHEPVLLHVDGACRLLSTTNLAEPNARVALGPNFLNERPFVEVGHPVLARGPDRTIAAAWVQEPKSDANHHVMLRTFVGGKLCR